jgi:hypothetical protein
MHPEYVFGVTEVSALAASERVGMPGVAVYRDGELDGVLRPQSDLDELATTLKKIARPLMADLALKPTRTS